MRILVYGCGVIGSLTAHELIRAGNDVTVLARGRWKEVLEQEGLVIGHRPSMRTTRDRPRIIDTLDAGDRYDLIVVVMQWTQLPAVIPSIAKNTSPAVLLIGNNPDPSATIEGLRAHDDGKTVLFGFQMSAGHRDEHRVVSFHMGVPITIGAAHGEASRPERSLVESTFAGSKCRLTWEKNMAEWLAAHLALVLPAVYLCRSTGFNLKRANWGDAGRMLDAVKEARALLRDLGMSVNDKEDAGFEPGAGRLLAHATLWLMAKTPVGRLAASDHCRNAPDEMDAFDQAFEKMRAGSDLAMPTWDSLRRSSRITP